jgi:hemolysin activation/secretion protein
VVFVLKPKQKHRQAALGVDNRGPHLLGNLIVQGGLDFYRTLIDGDQLSFSGYATPDFKHYRALDGSYAVPIGTDGLTLTGSTAWIWTRARKVDIKGKAQFAGLSLTYPILRQAHRAADISIGIDGTNSDNALFGNVFATEKSRAARLAGSFVSASEADNFQASAIVSQGLDIFGANVGDTDAQIGFTKVNATANYERVLARRLLGRIYATAQYSRDRLPAVELFTVGGLPVGRAFDTGLLTGDRGIGGFVELAYRPIASGNFQRSEAYVFADAASLTVNRRDVFPRQHYSLGSAGGGLRARYKERMQFGVEAAAVTNRPYPTYDHHFRLSFYYSILF